MISSTVSAAAALSDGLTALVVRAAATPAPTPGPEFNQDTVTPGLIGFLVMFAIAVAAVLLAVDMVRRVRRTTYRAQVNERLDEEQRAEGAAPRDGS